MCMCEMCLRCASLAPGKSRYNVFHERITFKPGDMVVREARIKHWDSRTNELYYYIGKQIGRVVDFSAEYGTVKVQWGIRQGYRERETEWCQPAGFDARIRNGIYEDIVDLVDCPS